MGKIYINVVTKKNEKTTIKKRSKIKMGQISIKRRRIAIKNTTTSTTTKTKNQNKPQHNKPENKVYSPKKYKTPSATHQQAIIRVYTNSHTTTSPNKQ